MKGGEENLIVVKKIHKHGGHHGGAWKVAYADFVTAMMALFIVLWILGQDEEVKQSVAGYFKDPVGFSEKMKAISIMDGRISLPTDSAQAVIEKIKERESEVERLKAMKDSIISNLSCNGEFKNLLDQVKMEIVNEGLRIEMMESNDDVFFEIGTSELRPEAQKLMVSGGLESGRIDEVRGYADTRLLDKNDPFNLVNRRISIIIKFATETPK